MRRNLRDASAALRQRPNEDTPTTSGQLHRPIPHSSHPSRNTHTYTMAAMTSTFLGSAVAVKAPVKVAAKKAVAPVASLDGLKKVRALPITKKPISRASVDTDDARPAFDAEARSRRPVRCGTSRARPRPIRTTRRRRVARRAPRRTSAAHRPSRASSRKTTIRRETLTSLVVRSLAGCRRRCRHRPHGVPRVRRHHQARRRQRRARLLRK